MRLIYTIGVSLYGLAIYFAAPFNTKAKLWIRGRKNWRTRLQAVLGPEEKWIWFHCASLGEFEQGRNLIEAIRREHPEYKILLTFFSPSGFEIRKNYAQADLVAYLPLDRPANVRDFLSLLKPQLAIFIKYEIWVNYLLEMQKRKIPVVLVSAYVKEDSRFLRSPLSPLFRKAFAGFRWIFTQDAATQTLLQDHFQVRNISVSGDTRFDRALSLLEDKREIEGIREFVGNDFCWVAGSPWPRDEALLLEVWQEIRHLPVKLIMAPHEIHPRQIQEQIAQFPEEMIAFSRIEELKACHKVLWIDNIGMLSRLYRYADLVYIGGGFGKSIHNTQEPAVYGNPVAFGPNYRMFHEAHDMVERECGFPVENREELRAFFQRFYQDRELLSETRQRMAKYMLAQGGATRKVVDQLKALGLLSPSA